MNENQISKIVLDCAFSIHKKLGPGLLESAYQEILRHELILKGLDVVKEKPFPIVYNDFKLDR